MKLTQSLLITSALLLGGILLAGTSQAESYPTFPHVNYGKGPHAAMVKRGEYLAKLGDCIACHTDEKGGKPFSGGRALKTPFGTFYSQNITPDKATGIGNWTQAQFDRVMHEGIRPDGTYNFPVFPYLWYTKINKHDLKDLYAYLMALPPVNRPDKKPDAIWPISWRFSQFGWRLLAFKPENFKYDKKHTKQWNRGAYLVESYGHCGMCHTPVNFLGIPKRDYMLTGSPISGMLAPNITSTGVVKNAPIKEIVDVFKKHRLIGGGQVAGGMLEVDKDSLRYARTSDLRAIAVYLKSFKSKKQPKKIVISGTGSAAGKAVYQSTCSACHEHGSGGAPTFGDKSDWAPLIKKGMNTLFNNAIHGYKTMPAKGTCMSCTDQQVKDAVTYMVDAAKSGNGGPKMVGKPYPKLTMADGKHVYNGYCAVCHLKGHLGAPKVGDKAAWAPLIKQGIPVLFWRTVKGYHNMPAKGACSTCSGAELKAAVVYMVQNSKTSGDYSLWLN